jgi:hypothetical protein
MRRYFPSSVMYTNTLVSGSCGVLEFALIYDELNTLLLVNILQAKVQHYTVRKDFETAIFVTIWALGSS